MKIAQIVTVPMPPREGIGNFTMGLSKALSRLGHEVTVFTKARRRSVSIYDGICIESVPYLPTYPFHTIPYAAFLSMRLRELGGFDVYHFHSPLSPPFVGFQPSITTVHTAMAHDIPMGESVELNAALGILQLPFSIWLERMLFRSSKMVCAVSKSVATSLGDYGLKPETVRITPNGISEEEYGGTQCSRRLSILYVGRLGPRKGLFDLLRAHALLVQGLSLRIPLKVIGEGPLRPHLEKYCQAMGTSGLVEFAGFVPRSEVLRGYREEGVVAIPSHFEGMPSVLLEAWASGVAVVAASSPGIVDIAQSGRTALLYPPGDCVSLANCLKDVLKSDGLAKRLGSTGCSYVMANFTWRKLATDYIETYEKVT